MRHWIFDLDGTLVNSFPSYTGVLTDVFQELGVTVSDEDLADARHHVLPKFLARFFSPEQIDAAFEKVLETSIARQAEIAVYSGVNELLHFLHSSGCTLSVFTARERKSALAILEHTGLKKFFSQVVTRDCVVNCKPFPDGIHHILKESQSHVDVTVMIGDHRMDMESAKAAGIKGISISWDGTPSHSTDLSDHHFTEVSELHSWAVAQLGQ